MKKIIKSLKKKIIEIIIVSSLLLIYLFFVEKNIITGEYRKILICMYWLYIFIHIGTLLLVANRFSIDGLIHFGKKIAECTYKKHQLTDDDLKNNKEYYRDILNVNSPLVIGYVDDFELNKNKLIAELLYLKYRSVIDFVDQQIMISNNIDKNSLFCSELYILDNIKHGKLKIVNYEYFMENLKNKVTQDAQSKLELLKIKSVDTRKTNILFIIYVILSIFAIGLMIAEVSYVFPAIIVGYFSQKMVELDKAKYLRTKKGKELNKKMEGLKQYLKDYSLLNEKESDSLLLWDEYLIYAVMFGQNTKIVNEIESYIV